MALGLPPLLTLVPGLALGALLVLLLRVGPSNRASRAFTLFVFLATAQWAVAVFITSADGAAGAFWQRIHPYTWIPQPFVLAYFAAVYPEPRRWLPRGPWGGLPFAAGAVLAVVGYAAFRGLAAPVTPEGWAFSFHQALPPVLALVFARDHFRNPDGRHGVLLVSLGFLLATLFWWSKATPAFLIQGSSAAPVGVLISAAGLAAIGYVAWRGARAPEAEVRGAAWRYVAVGGGFAAAGYALFFHNPPWPPPSLSWWLHALASTAMPVLVAYAILRQRAFGLDVQLRWTIQQSTVAGVFLAVYVVTSQAVAAFAEGTLGPLLGMVAAAAVIFLLLPVQRFAERVAARAVPPTRPAEAVPSAALEAYRSAVEHALGPDGRVGREDLPRLQALRARLGLSDRDHAVLEHTLLAVRDRAAAFDPAPGAVLLRRYRLTQVLGQGSFGRTFLAQDEVLHRAVVVKTLRPERLGDAGVEAFLREARLLAGLQHPNLVTVHDVERVGPWVCLILEYVDGGSLEDLLRRARRLPVDEAVALAEEVLAGLEAAHARGIVHRDVKPANILLGRDGKVKLTDFGAAREASAAGTVTASALTAGAGVGTLTTMAPEAARGGTLDARSDLYSLGAVLYRMVAGKHYLDLRGCSDFEAREAILARRPRLAPASRSPALEAVLARALAKDPAERYPSAAAMRAALAEVRGAEGRTGRARVVPGAAPGAGGGAN